MFAFMFTGFHLVIVGLAALALAGVLTGYIYWDNKREDRKRRLITLATRLETYKLDRLAEIIKDLAVSDLGGCLAHIIQLVKEVDGPGGDVKFLELLKPSWIAQLAVRAKDPECVTAWDDAQSAAQQAEQKKARAVLNGGAATPK
jgi:type II secretory pathway pseudopilin PulG